MLTAKRNAEDAEDAEGLEGVPSAFLCGLRVLCVQLWLCSIES
jgi:hypothetical protein